jgi:hypothetical protein
MSYLIGFILALTISSKLFVIHNEIELMDIVSIEELKIIK